MTTQRHLTQTEDVGMRRGSHTIGPFGRRLTKSRLTKYNLFMGSHKDTQTPRRINISTPSVADVSSNNSNNIESSTSTPPAHIVVCAPTRLLSSSGQCASAAPHGKQIFLMERRASCSVHKHRHESQTTSIALRPHYTAAGGAGGKGCTRLKAPIYFSP